MKKAIEVNLLVKLLNDTASGEEAKRELVQRLNGVQWLAYNWRFSYEQDRGDVKAPGRIVVQARD